MSNNAGVEKDDFLSSGNREQLEAVSKALRCVKGFDYSLKDDKFVFVDERYSPNEPLGVNGFIRALSVVGEDNQKNVVFAFKTDVIFDVSAFPNGYAVCEAVGRHLLPGSNKSVFDYRKKGLAYISKTHDEMGLNFKNEHKDHLLDVTDRDLDEIKDVNEKKLTDDEIKILVLARLHSLRLMKKDSVIRRNHTFNDLVAVGVRLTDAFNELANDGFISTPNYPIDRFDNALTITPEGLKHIRQFAFENKDQLVLLTSKLLSKKS